mgnify:CR=1 FL=1
MIVLGGGLRVPYPLAAGQHVHACPVCYEHVRCEHDGCSWEPDQDLTDETPGGSVVTCDACALAARGSR